MHKKIGKASVWLRKSVQRKWTGVVESFAEFAQDTTAHGVKFFFQGKKLSRVAFFLVWLSAVLYTFYTCYKGVADYKLRPTGTKFEVEMVGDADIPFPTISLCNINRIRKDYLDKNQQIKKMVDYFNQMEVPRLDLNMINKTAPETHAQQIIDLFKDDPVINTTLQSVYKEGGPLNSDVIICKVGFQDCSDYLGKEVFERVVSQQGNCFKINPKGIIKANIAGNLGGITLFLHAQHSQYSLVRLIEPSEGFKISLHSSQDDGEVGNTGFVVSPGLQYFIQLGYTETNLLESPYGDCLKNDTYRYSKCTHNCILEHVLNTCKCVPYVNNDDELFNNKRLCTLKDMLSCAIKANSDIVRNSTLRKKQCQCSKSCKIFEYKHSVSSSLLSNSFINSLMKMYNKRLEETNHDKQEQEIETQQDLEHTSIVKGDDKTDNTNPKGRGKRRKKWEDKFRRFQDKQITNKNNDTAGNGTTPTNLKRGIGNRLAKVLVNQFVKLTAENVKENIVILKITFPSIEKHTVNQIVTYGIGNLLGDIGGVLGLFLGGSIFTVLEFLDYIVRIVHQNIVNLKTKREKEKKQDKTYHQDILLPKLHNINDNNEFTKIPVEELET